MTDRKTVLLVVCFLGAFALLGLAGVVWLVSTGTASDAVAIVSTLTGSALGSSACTTPSAPASSASSGQSVSASALAIRGGV